MPLYIHSTVLLVLFCVCICGFHEHKVEHLGADWMTCCKIVKYGINLGGLRGFKNDLVAVIYFIFCVVSLCHHFHVSLHVLLYCFLSEVSVYWWHLVTMTEIRHQWSLTDTPHDEYFIDAIRAINKMTALVQLKIFTALKGTLHYLFWDLKKTCS